MSRPTQDKFVSAPHLKSMVLVDGEIEVEVEAERILLSVRGPQGGRSRTPFALSGVQLERVIALLDLAADTRTTMARERERVRLSKRGIATVGDPT